MSDIRVQDEQGTIHVFPEGSTPQMIAQAMNVKPPSVQATSATPEQPGFAARASQQVGLTQHPIDQLIGELKQLKDHPIDTLWESVKQPITGLRDLAYNLVRHPVDTVQQVTGGKQFATDVQAGNYRGALGTLAGDAAQVAMLGAPKQTVAAVGAAGEKTGVVGSRALLLGKTPEEAYQSALKPSTTLSQGERAAVVKTGLEEGIPVTQKGLTTLGSLIDDLNTKVKAQIAADPNRPINKFKVTPKLNETAQRFSNQVSPTADLNAVGEVGNDFLATAPNPIPAQQAQAMKQGTYRALGDKSFGELKGASVEAQKALARGLKDEIAAQFPELAQLNAREGKLLDLQPVLERAVNRIGNHQLAGIGTPIAAGAAKAVTGSSTVAAVAGVMKAALDNPAVKSRLAISLSKGAGIGPAQAMQRIDAYANSLRTAGVASVAGQSRQSGAGSGSGGADTSTLSPNQ